MMRAARDSQLPTSAPRPPGGSQPLLRRATEALRDVEWLDEVGDPARDAVLSWIPDGTRQTLRGSWLGHPVHPTLTDLPIGLWTSSVVLDALGGEEQAAAADRLLLLGILTAMPTAAVGMLDWAESGRAARRQGLVHMASNVLALALFSWSARARRRSRKRGRRLSRAAAIALVVGGYIGGHLAYAEGVGVERQAAREPASPPTRRRLDFTPRRP